MACGLRSPNGDAGAPGVVTCRPSRWRKRDQHGHPATWLSGEASVVGLVLLDPSQPRATSDPVRTTATDGGGGTWRVRVCATRRDGGRAVLCEGSVGRPGAPSRTAGRHCAARAWRVIRQAPGCMFGVVAERTCAWHPPGARRWRSGIGERTCARHPPSAWLIVQRGHGAHMRLAPARREVDCSSGWRSGHAPGTRQARGRLLVRVVERTCAWHAPGARSIARPGGGAVMRLAPARREVDCSFRRRSGHAPGTRQARGRLLVQVAERSCAWHAPGARSIARPDGGAVMRPAPAGREVDSSSGRPCGHAPGTRQAHG